MPHLKLSAALLNLSETNFTSDANKQELKSCLIELANLADSEYVPVSDDDEAKPLPDTIAGKLIRLTKR